MHRLIVHILSLMAIGSYCHAQPIYFDNLYLTDQRVEGLGPGTTQTLSYGYVNWNNGFPNGQNYSSQSIFITDFHGNLLSSADLPVQTDVSEMNGNLIVENDSTFIVLSFQQIIGDTIPGDIILRQLTDSGDEVWKRELGSNDRREIPQRFHRTEDGGFLIVGQVVLPDGVDEDGQLLMVKCDGSGFFEWERIHGGTLYESARDFIQTQDRGYLILGWTRSFGAGERDFYLIKTDSLGNEEWFETYGTTNDEVGRSILELSDGNYLLTGSGSQPSGSGSQGMLFKVSPSGQEIWSEGYIHNNNSGNNLHSSVELSNGDLVSTGMTNPDSNAGYLVKTDSQGNVIWERQYDRNEHTDLFYSVLATNDGGFLLSGQARNDSTLNQDAWLLKVDSIGCPYPNCTVGINDFEPTEVVVDVWPNPASDVVQLQVQSSALNGASTPFGSAQGSPISLTVLDMQGRTVCKDRDCHGRASLAMTGNASISVTDWPDGLYVLTITGEKVQSSVRIVVQH